MFTVSYLFCYRWTCFIPFSRVSFVDSEQVNFCWESLRRCPSVFIMDMEQVYTHKVISPICMLLNTYVIAWSIHDFVVVLKVGFEVALHFSDAEHLRIIWTSTKNIRSYFSYLIVNDVSAWQEFRIFRKMSINILAR